MAQRTARLPRTGQYSYAAAGILSRLAATAGVRHAQFLAARGRHRPHHHWPPELGRPGVWLQVGLVAAGGPAADSVLDPPAWAQAQLVVVVATGHHGRAGVYGPDRPQARTRPDCLGCAGGGVWFGDAGHCAGRLPHRIGTGRASGGIGRHLPDRLPPGHDLGRCGRSVDCGARRGG